MSLKTFTTEVLANFYTVAAISPSSIHLASAMVEPLPLSETLIAVELGAGTGSMTRALLDELPRRATLLAFEINPRFVNYLKANFRDPRLVLINESVENIEQELRRRGYDHADAVVSSLGLGFMSERKRRKIFDALMPFVRPHTVLTQFQYVHAMQFSNGRLRRLSLKPLLNDYFDSVESRIIWRNLPPAYVYTCQLQGNRRRSCSDQRRVDDFLH
jgi:phosphatidylethanolamine/phosphatidyl-N-methylethanolamine N-methyltransferase